MVHVLPFLRLLHCTRCIYISLWGFLPVLLLSRAFLRTHALPQPYHDHLPQWAPNLDSDWEVVLAGTSGEMNCATHIHDQEEVEEAEREFRRLREEVIGSGGELEKREPMSFDVHIHVVYGDKSNTIGGYLSDKDIHAQMRVLNEGFASVGVSWNLVNISRVHQLDWFLNIGIDIFGPKERAMKTSLRQGGASTLNIYTVSFYNTARTPHRGMLGYSTIPRDYAIAPALDGVVISYTVFPGGTQKSYHLGHTLTHEAGHWLGLYHTFQGGCSGSEGVSETGGDQVDDTPPQRNSTEGCPIFRDTCRGGGLDAIDNFMDYSPDECRNNFTPGQGTRMLQQAQVYRGK